MKILLISPWENVWVKYLRKYFETLGHTFVFKHNLDLNIVNQADVVICGWADGYAKALGEFPKLAEKYICFLRSYEYYSDIFRKVNWANFDCCFVVNQYIYSQVKDEIKCTVLSTRNAIDLETVSLSGQEVNKDILFLADINHKKGIQLLTLIARELPERRFTLAGRVQDRRFMEYIKEQQLPNLKYVGYSVDVRELFNSHGYILSCSPAEGNPNNIIEGMAYGLNPVVHRYLGYEGQFPESCYYTTVHEAIELLQAKRKPHDHHKFIEETYDMNIVYDILNKVAEGTVNV